MMMYNIPQGGHFMVRPDWQRAGIPMSYNAPLATEYWDDDGSSEKGWCWRSKGLVAGCN